MAGSVNKVILVGHLGADPEMKALPSGMQMAKLRVATSETWTDKTSGQRQEKTEWHNVIVYDKLAGICERYLSKGQLVFIEGSIQTRSWDDKETGQKRYMTEIKARDMRMLGGRPDGARGSAGAPSAPEPPMDGDPDDSVPF
ncbi:MAG: single-stranded DNA-binding protein [Thermoanaerobaculia bacterium]|jgi:single-strand DNA-binding protein|nr:single-stranded DNA-binding protein [Thermoanaerobaculia bacterium]